MSGRVTFDITIYPVQDLTLAEKLACWHGYGTFWFEGLTAALRGPSGHAVLVKSMFLNQSVTECPAVRSSGFSVYLVHHS